MRIDPTMNHVNLVIMPQPRADGGPAENFSISHHVKNMGLAGTEVNMTEACLLNTPPLPSPQISASLISIGGPIVALFDLT